MARDKNTYAKRQRETLKRQKAEAREETSAKGAKKRQANRAPTLSPANLASN